MNPQFPSLQFLSIYDRLDLIASMAEILNKKSVNFEDKKLSAQLTKIYEDLNQIIIRFLWYNPFLL